MLQRFRKLTTALQSTPSELLQRFVTWFVHILVKRFPIESRDAMESIMATIHEKGASEVRSNLEKTLDDIIGKRFKEGIALNLRLLMISTCLSAGQVLLFLKQKNVKSQKR